MALIEAITSTAANGIAIGRNAATNPVLKVDCSTASAAAGVTIIGRAAAAGVDLNVISSGTNENLVINAKGSGTISLNPTGTGAIALARNTAVTGTLGVSSDVAVNTDKFTVAASSGNTVVAGTLAVAGNVAVATNKFTVAAASGNTLVAGTLAVTGAATFTAAAKLTGATGGIGYATGAGGAVTQDTSRTTGVTLNTVCGAVTLVSAAGSTTPASFTVTNSAVAATDVVHVCQKSGTDIYDLSVSAVAAGSFRITFNTKSGTTTEQPVFNFAVIKAVAA